MDTEKAVLTTTQILELTDIDDESNHGDSWCDVSEVSKDVLKELDSAGYIVTNAERTSGRITAMGMRALKNYVLRGSLEHGQMLLEKTNVPKKPYASVMRKSNGDLPERQTAAKVCVVEGCHEPRMATKKGVMLRRCRAHQQEWWREQAAKKRSPAVKISKKETTGSGGEKITAVNASCDQDCDGCIHREVVAMLRAKYPGIDELVDVMTRARELRDELGI